MTRSRLPVVAALTRAPNWVRRRTATPNQIIRQTRMQVMGGFGPGANQATINNATRDRTFIAGRPVALRLEDLAQQTLKERGDTAGVVKRIIRIVQRSLMVVGVIYVIGYTLLHPLGRAGGSQR